MKPKIDNITEDDNNKFNNNEIIDGGETLDDSFTPFTAAASDIVDVQTDELSFSDNNPGGQSIQNGATGSKSFDYEQQKLSSHSTTDTMDYNITSETASDDRVDQRKSGRMVDAPVETIKDVLVSCGRIALTGCKEVVFDIAAIPRELSAGHRGHTVGSMTPRNQEKTYYEAYPWQGKLFHRSSPPSLLVSAPVAHIELLKPEHVPSRDDTTGSQPVSILQGVVHRIDVAFDSREDEVRNGYLYLSVDPPPTRTKSAFFWMPNAMAISDRESGWTEEQIDRVPFHPLALDEESLQPANCFKIPSQSNNAKFGTALYVMSEVAGVFTITIKLEYVNSSLLSIPVTKEFNIKCEVVRPFAVNFTISSLRDAPCGVQRNLFGLSNENSTYVLKDDVISISTSIACLNALGSAVELLGLKLVPFDDNMNNSGINFICKEKY